MPWWLTFLFAFAVAAVAIGALCWQLWRHRDYETERRQYWNAKMKAEMNYPDEPMNVADLIAALQQHDPRATVVVWDHTASDQPAVAKLGYGEVQTMQLGAWESNGLRVLEVWAPNMGLDGPFAGVVLGDGLAPITAEQHRAIAASEASEPIGAPPDTALHLDIMTMMNNGTVAAPSRVDALRKCSNDYLRDAMRGDMSAHSIVTAAYQAGYCALLAALGEADTAESADHPDYEAAHRGAGRLGIEPADSQFAVSLALNYYSPDRDRLATPEQTIAWAQRVRRVCGWDATVETVQDAKSVRATRPPLDDL